MTGLKQLVLKTRSYRRFDSSLKLKSEELIELVKLTRFTGSAANLQPLKYIVSTNPGTNRTIYQNLSWAGYLNNWNGPVENERPAGYIVILTDTNIRENADIDIGLSAQTILLAASERGLGGCMFASFQRDTLTKLFAIPQNLKISLIIALGKPLEKVVIEDAEPGSSIKYYRDKESVHHVPKRTLEEILFKVY
ncbi:MAG: nitroreductase family protein [Spirochaetales bacterium]|nr:nitroreductase family protein [Spirochaetales bacterium]